MCTAPVKICEQTLMYKIKGSFPLMYIYRIIKQTHLTVVYISYSFNVFTLFLFLPLHGDDSIGEILREKQLRSQITTHLNICRWFWDIKALYHHHYPNHHHGLHLLWGIRRENKGVRSLTLTQCQPLFVLCLFHTPLKDTHLYQHVDPTFIIEWSVISATNAP